MATRGQDHLVAAAGIAVGLEAKRLLGSCYGRRVAVIVGPGLNGADGRVSAEWLRGRGALVDLIEVATQPDVISGYDLLIDAAFGLGCSRPYVAPRVTPGTLVLCVDLPSGVDADEGILLGQPLRATSTLALGALKFAHVTGHASDYVGEIRFAGLGIVEDASSGMVEDSDMHNLVRIKRDDHKWTHAVQVFAGSRFMPGAGALVARGAMAGGASMVCLSSRGEQVDTSDVPPEVVRTSDTAIDPRCRAVVAGPGLGQEAGSWLAPRLADARVPVVLDADGLERSLLSAISQREWVLTPHQGEFERLIGGPLPASRLSAVKLLALETRCIVLLKGSTTLIADPAGRVRVVQSGTPALATAGSGDVLAGLIAAAIARGHEPLEAAALAAHLHGRAGARMPTYGSATDLLSILSRTLHD